MDIHTPFVADEYFKTFPKVDGHAWPQVFAHDQISHMLRVTNC
jgi:hypothetical protein